MIYLSVIVPVRNEARFIGQTLAELADQDYPRDRYEVLVVDGRSEDKTREIVQEFIDRHSDVNIRLLDNPGKLSSRARNVGIREAKGVVIAVIDGHVHIPSWSLLMDMERARRELGALCLSRPAPLDAPGVSGAAYWIAVARKSWLGHSRASYIYSDHEGFVDPMSSGFAYDRSVFERVGFFDETFDAAEDVEFHFRLRKAGIQAYTTPRFLIYSYPRESIRALFRQQVRYGEGRARFVHKHPEGFTVETAIPVALLLFLAGLPLVIAGRQILGHLASLYTFGVLLYAVTLLTTGMREAVSRGRFLIGVYVAAAIGATHIGLGWGFMQTWLALRFLRADPRHGVQDLPGPRSGSLRL